MRRTHREDIDGKQTDRQTDRRAQAKKIETENEISRGKRDKETNTDSQPLRDGFCRFEYYWQQLDPNLPKEYYQLAHRSYELQDQYNLDVSLSLQFLFGVSCKE